VRSAREHGRLAAVVSSVLGNQVPVTVTALEAMARLLGVLEEVNADTRLVVYEPVMLKLTSACAAVRHQVSLSACMDNIPRAVLLAAGYELQQVLCDATA